MEEGQLERRRDAGQLDRVEKSLIRLHDKFDVAMNGPDGSPEKGMFVRVDRVEQKQKWIWYAVMGSVVAIVKAFWATITGK